MQKSYEVNISFYEMQKSYEVNISFYNVEIL